MMRDYLIRTVIASDVLIIGFTSYGFHSEPPRNEMFEWAGASGRVNTHEILLRDSFQHWYHGACLDFGASLRHTLSRIRAYIAEHSISKIITIGSSMGGHGAMLFGALLKANHCIAFAPQVNMDQEWLEAIGDQRWPTKSKEMNWIGYPNLNLARLFETARPQETFIYFDESNHLDEAHATTVAQIAGCRLFAIQGGGHEIAYKMAKTGEVTSILRAAIGGSFYTGVATQPSLGTERPDMPLPHAI